MAKASNSDLHNKIYDTVVENLKSQGYDVNFQLVEKVVKSQWEFLVNVIRFGEHYNLRCKYLGIFGCKRFKEAFMQKRYLNKEQRDIYFNLEYSERPLYLEKVYREYKERTKLEYSHLEQPVICYNKKGLEIARYKTLREASETLNIAPISIFISCSKSSHTKRGLKFKFVDQIEHKEEENP